MDDLGCRSIWRKCTGIAHVQPDLPRTKGLQKPIELIHGQILSAFMTFIMEMSTACYKEVTAGILFLPDYVDLRLMRLFNVILRVKFVQDLVGLI